ncbi:MAG TPA: hypothetical protein VH061_03860 [Solirubrobacteraceae bacterium]|nr:hypothetical protein [Solirubrobacteraceae bacterium]
MDTAPDKDPTTAFVSWAHGDDAWEETIARFVFTLRELGIEADVDLFHLNDAAVNWATYGAVAATKSDFVVVAVSSRYRERWEETGDPTVGAGAAREANVLKTLFDQDRHEFYRKVKLAVLPGATEADVPVELGSAVQRFDVRTLDSNGLDGLVRTLTGQPSYIPPPVGAIPILPPRLLAAGGEHALELDHASEFADLRSRLGELEAALAGSQSQDAVDRNALNSERTTLKAAIEVVTSSSSRPSSNDHESTELSQAINPLVEALDDSDGTVRFNAMAALRSHLRPGLLPVIEPLLKDPDKYIRGYAVDYYAELQRGQ